MPKHHRTLTRSLAAGLAVCAIAPGTALAVPAIEGPGASPDSGPAVSAQQDLRAPDQTGSRADGATKQDLRAPDQTGSRADGTTKQDLRAPDQITGPVTRGVPAPTAPQSPVKPQPIVPHTVATAKPSNDGGVDTAVWIALGAGALTVAAGIGIAGAKRLRTGRQRQLA
jgi:hypothetical protein